MLPKMRLTGPSELQAFISRISRIPGEFVVHDDGYRGWTFSYGDIASMAEMFRRRLRAAGLRRGHAVMIWSESRPGWIAALWGCLLEGVTLVPVDPQSSVGLFDRIRQKVEPCLILRGDRVPAFDCGNAVPVWLVSDIESDIGGSPDEPTSVSNEEIAEIVFTSGTTAEPKGVLITHRNLSASLRPMEDQLAPYVKFVRPFAPLRILNLLPMSHLFGQALATFVPPLIPASVTFISSTSPQEIAAQIRRRRLSVLVCVPRILEMMRNFVVLRIPHAAGAKESAETSWPLRWWRFRAVHRLFGWKFCCIVTGGAPLPADLEAFWRGLGYVVVQGYGLTETAPIISFNHPLHGRHGSVGAPLKGVDIRVADDGEVLVRGENVSPGYFASPVETASAFQDGWLRTGDIGELGPDGNLVIRGRKKEVIVTSEGLKAFPEDVEAVLAGIPGVQDAAVIGENRVHAVLLLQPGADAAGIVRRANEHLETHQRIRSFSLWTKGPLPRTAATGKLRRGYIAEAVQRGTGESAATPGSGLADLIRKYAPGRELNGETTLNELGLSSLDRVELMMSIEEKLGTRIDENAFASVRTIADLERSVPSAEPTPFPVWNRTPAARAIRHMALASVLLPLTRAVAHVNVSGLENLTSLRGPVIFAANHQSHLDTPVILASLPSRWRYGIATAMWKEYFDASFHPDRHSPGERLAKGALYRSLALLFNAFPVPQTETGTREAVRYMGELVEEGWSILIFPEGERTLTGAIGRFYPGVGMIASRLRVPVVPIRLEGVDRVLHRNAKWPSPGPVHVRYGPPIRPAGASYEAVAGQVEEAVRNL
jgi:long-chain acyl-CoA synthetase